MNATADDFLRKTVFWQRFAFFVLTIFLLVMWASCLYFFSDWIGKRSLEQMFRREESYFFLVFIGYLLAGSYVDYILWQASSALNKYIVSVDIVHLEEAFRKQRHFWMGLTLMILSVFLIFILLMFLFALL